MAEVRKVTRKEIADKYTLLDSGVAEYCQASGINTEIVEKQLVGVANRKGLLYSHTYLVNVDAIPSEYMMSIVQLFKDNPEGVEYKQLNGFNLVIKMRVNHGEEEPELPMRGEKVKVSASTIVDKEGVTLTHDKHPYLKGLPLYTVRDYRIATSTKARSLSDAFAQMEERSELPIAKTTADTTQSANVKSTDIPF